MRARDELAAYLAAVRPDSPTMNHKRPGARAPSPAPGDLRLFLGWPSLFVAVLLLPACGRGPAGDAGLVTQAFQGATMGTYYSVKVVADELPEERIAGLQAAIDRELEDVDSKMSTYREGSEISRFNRHLDTAPFPVSAATFEVTSAALDVARFTGGAYDVTVGPLVDAWGFGPGASAADLDDEAIAALLERVGFSRLALDPASSALRKLRPDLEVDLSSIAKGYAVDQVFEALATEGFEDVWVEVGGEVRAGGTNAGGVAWRLGIELPRLTPGALQRIVPLANAAAATSGDYRNYRERDGARFSHIIDPRTGWPIRHRLASVSVVHSRCMTADALATALMVLGPEEGLELAAREGLPALFLVRAGNGFEERATPAFEALVEAASGGERAPEDP